MTGRDHLVVVLPGNGGSVLASPSRPEELIWSGGLRNVGHILRQPEDLSVEDRPRLLPVGVIRSRKVFGVWTAIRGYGGLLNRLAVLPNATLDNGSGPPSLDANVVAVGYDFRLGVVDAAEEVERQVQPRLAHRWPNPDDRRGRVLIVAHSLGGLVARYWAGQPDNRPLCRAMLTLGTPHRGAPKALDVLANGVAVQGGHLKRPRAVLRGWRSVYELLPRYPAVTDQSQPPIPGQGPLLRYPHELPLGWLAGPARAAYDVHREIDRLWSGGETPAVEPRIGYGHGTLRRAVWDGTRVRVSTDAPDGHDLGLWGQDRGDGTVPAFSGLPRGAEGVNPAGLLVPLRHGPITDLEEVAAWVESFEGRPSLRNIEGDERPVVLGVDIDQVALAGTPVPVAVRVVGTEESPHAAPVVAALTSSDDSSFRPSVRLYWDATGRFFRGELPGLSVGMYDLRVIGEEIPQAGDLQTSETLEVIADDDLD